MQAENAKFKIDNYPLNTVKLPVALKLKSFIASVNICQKSKILGFTKTL